jgi:quercetin dioxygenase-like cupin family protein
MITRRGFGTFASRGICAAAGLVATEALAQGAPLAPTPGVTRKVLSSMDGPMPGYMTIIVETQIEPGVAIARHTHPGIETGFVVEGSFDLPIEGQPTRALGPGDAFQVPTGTPHAGGKPMSTRVTAVSTYVVEKGKPLTSPA